MSWPAIVGAILGTSPSKTRITCVLVDPTTTDTRLMTEYIDTQLTQGIHVFLIDPNRVVDSPRAIAVCDEDAVADPYNTLRDDVTELRLVIPTNGDLYRGRLNEQQFCCNLKVIPLIVPGVGFPQAFGSSFLRSDEAKVFIQSERIP